MRTGDDDRVEPGAGMVDDGVFVVQVRAHIVGVDLDPGGLQVVEFASGGVDLLNGANRVHEEALAEFCDGVAEVVPGEGEEGEFEFRVCGFDLLADGVGGAIGRGEVQLHRAASDEEVGGRVPRLVRAELGVGRIRRRAIRAPHFMELHGVGAGEALVLEDDDVVQVLHQIPRGEVGRTGQHKGGLGVFRVTDDELVALMQQAVLGVMPSLEEGFGLPIAEMVACETPVLCSATSSMPEVAGCDDALFDPYDVEDLARLLDHALNDAHFRQHVLTEETQRLQRWTVDQVGAEIVSALQQPTRPRRTPTTKPLSVAFAAPHPRSASGIGPYTHMVLEHWPHGDDVIALDDCSVLDERLNSRATQRAAVGVGSIGRTFRSHDVDHLVITLGSSEHHAVSLERAAMGDAHLWLHEATALGAVIGPAHFGGGERWAQQRLSALGVEHSVGVDVMNPEELHRCGITGLEQAIKEARSIIVTSQEGREALTAEYGASLPPITVIPLAHPTRSQSAVGGNRVVSFGVVDDNKRPEELLQLLAKCDDLHLDLIGSITSEQRTKLIDYSTQLGVEERLAIHGRASDSTLDGLLTNVRCAVQFREGHPGQMSAAICELLARGVPVITDMTTHGEGHEGLVVIDSGDVNAAANAVEAFRDGNAAQHAGNAARSHAMQWTATHVAEALREWLLQQSALRTGSTL